MKQRLTVIVSMLLALSGILAVSPGGAAPPEGTLTVAVANWEYVSRAR